MISYASLKRFEGDYAVCEIEQLSILESIIGDFSKEIYMTNVPAEMFNKKGISINVGYIYSVEHDGFNVTEVIRIEGPETRRRIEWLQIIGKKDLKLKT